MAAEPVFERAPDDAGPKDERLSLYPDVPFEEALRRLLSVDPRKLDPKEGETDGERS